MTLFCCQGYIRSSVLLSKASMSPSRDCTRSKKSSSDHLTLIVNLGTVKATSWTTSILAAFTGIVLLTLKDLFEQFIKVYLKNYSDIPLNLTLQEETIKRLLRARNLDLYYRNSYIKCYSFYKQYKNYFKRVKAKSREQSLFLVFFIKKRILYCWQQYTSQIECNIIISFTRDKFQIFSSLSLEKFTVFVYSV